MQFSTLFVSAAALFMGASATPITRDTHIADFRGYGTAGCSANNLGIYTVLDDGLDKCTPFNEVVKAVTLEDITKGCKFWVYSDKKCSKGKTPVNTGSCLNSVNQWKAWEIKCDE